MTRPIARRSPYRVNRRTVAAHRAHANAAYPACVLCIVESRLSR
jgi:hypothetical protein